MSQTIDVNGQSINYPETGDTNWGDEATDFAVQTSAAFGKLGLASGTSVDIAQTLDVTGNTTLDANLSVGGNATISGTTSLTGNVTLANNLTVNGNTALGNANTDTITVTGIVNVDSGTLYVDPVNNRVGVNKTNPAQALDITGNIAISGNETVGGTLGATGDFSINTNKFNVTALSGNTTIAGTLDVTSDVAVNTNKFNVTATNGNTAIAGTLGVTGATTLSSTLGVTGNTTLTGTLLNSDGNVSLPSFSYSADTNTGIYRSASDQQDFVTGGVSRARINSTGQQSSTVPDLSGSNTTLYNEYKCRAWANFNGTTASPITPRANGNISSITKNATGDYTVNFTTSMPDINYCANITMSPNYGLANIWAPQLFSGPTGIETAPLVSSFRFVIRDTSNNAFDPKYICISVFR